jgi:hypothetical protein
MHKLSIHFKILNSKLSSRKLFSGKNFIRNKELPICSKCVHFIEHTNNYPYDPIPCDEQYGRCKKFGEVNIITGMIEYDLASKCRLDNILCGKYGSEYTEKKYNEKKYTEKTESSHIHLF